MRTESIPDENKNRMLRSRNISVWPSLIHAVSSTQMNRSGKIIYSLRFQCFPLSQEYLVRDLVFVSNKSAWELDFSNGNYDPLLVTERCRVLSNHLQVSLHRRLMCLMPNFYSKMTVRRMEDLSSRFWCWVARCGFCGRRLRKKLWKDLRKF